MKISTTRIAFLVGVLCLIGLYFFPMWRISLQVPQYPKDITIQIWINQIANGTKKAMEIMNVLNHNIGMKEINPESIPELRYFPVVLAVIIALGIAAAFIKKNLVRNIWIAILMVALTLALIDFYLWLYDYGHNLADDAPLVIENSSFQPPLIGTKKIINFEVASYPLIGVIFPFASIIITFIAQYKSK